VATVAAFVNAFCRFWWAFTLDYFTFKQVILVLLAVQAVASGSIFYIAYSKVWYMVWICFTMACQGGVMAVIAAAVSKIYGPTVGGKMTAVTIYCFGIAALIFGLIQRFAISDIGYENMFWLLCALQIIGILVTIIFYSDENPWSAPYEGPTPLDVTPLLNK
jgi:MFS family permease